MKDIFVALIKGLSDVADINEAYLYEDNIDFSSIKYSYKGKDYKIMISREKSNGNNSD